MSPSAVVLAHGGGVPEALTVAVPVAVLVAVVVMERSARRRAAEQDGPAGPAGEEGHDGHDRHDGPLGEDGVPGQGEAAGRPDSTSP